MDIKKEKVGFEIQNINFEDTVQKIVMESIIKYFEFYLTKEYLYTSKKNYELFLAYKNKTQKLYSFELASKSDFLDSVSRELEAKLQNEMAMDEYKSSLENFQRYFFTKSDKLDVNFDNKKELILKPIKEYINQIDNNFEIKILRLNQKYQNIEIDKNKKYYMPKVSFILDYSKIDRYDDTHYESTSAMFQLQGKIYQGGYEKSAVMEAKMILNSYQKQEQYLKDNLIEQITQYYNEFQISKNSIKIFKTKIETLNQELKFLNKANKFGIRDLEEILTTQKKLYEIEFQELKSYVNMVVSYMYINYFISNCNKDTILEVVNFINNWVLKLWDQYFIEFRLLIKPVNNTNRSSWKENIEEVLANHKGIKDEGILEDLLNDNDLEDWQWQ